MVQMASGTPGLAARSGVAHTSVDHFSHKGMTFVLSPSMVPRVASANLLQHRRQLSVKGQLIFGQNIGEYKESGIRLRRR